MKNSRLFPSFLIAAAIAVVLATAARAADGETSTLKFSDPTKPGILKIRANLGDIRVRGADVAECTVKSDIQPEHGSPRKDGLRVLSASSTYALTEKNNIAVLEYGSDTHPGAGGSAAFDITVPRNTSVVIQKNWGGDIAVKDLSGDIEVKSLNGEIHLDDVMGGALVETMNGEIKATVRELHDGKPLSFTSMNGEVKLQLPADGKANVKMRTQNGVILTDFDEQVLVTKVQTLTRSTGTFNRRAPKVANAHVTNMNGSISSTELRAAARESAKAAREASAAMKDAAIAQQDAAHEMVSAAKEEAAAQEMAARQAVVAANEAKAASEEDAMAARAPMAPMPPLPPMTGGKLISGTLNGGGVEISVTTMNGDVTFRKIAEKK